MVLIHIMMIFKNKTMNRNTLLELKQENRNDKIIYDLINVIIGECDRIGKDLSEEQIISVMKKMYKNNEELYQQYVHLSSIKAYNITNVVKNENKFLSQFIPKQLSQNEIKEIVANCVKDGMILGGIMKHFKDSYSGLYDGRLVSEIARQEINKINGKKINNS